MGVWKGIENEKNLDYTHFNSYFFYFISTSLRSDRERKPGMAG